MSVALARVDNRLVHGQVLEAWLPKLNADTIVVVDDGVAGDPLRQSIMEIAVPSRVKCRFERVDSLKEALEELNSDHRVALVLFSSIKDARDALRMGVPLEKINVGNVHYQKGKERITPCISLSEDELHSLMEIQRRSRVELQTLPDESPLRFPECLQKGNGWERTSGKRKKWWQKWLEKFND